MDPDRRQRLEALPGWSWDALSDRWEEGFSYLKEFSEREGHCRVPGGFKTGDGYRLGSWVSHQRAAKDIMDPDRRQRLEALPGWSWDAFSDQWEGGFSHLKTFSEQERHCRVPDSYKTDDGYRLGLMVSNQRAAKDKMEPDRRQRLEALPGWVWDALSDKWEDGFSHLRAFSDREGHCRVPQHYKTDDGYGLVSGFQLREKLRTKWMLIVGSGLEALPGWVWKVEKAEKLAPKRRTDDSS